MAGGVIICIPRAITGMTVGVVTGIIGRSAGTRPAGSVVLAFSMKLGGFNHGARSSLVSADKSVFKIGDLGGGAGIKTSKVSRSPEHPPSAIGVLTPPVGTAGQQAAHKFG